MIGAGKRNKLMTFQQVTETITDEGEVTETWSTLRKAWVAIEPLTAREAWVAQQSQATTTHKITALYDSGVTSRHQGTWNSRTFKFESVRNIDEGDREMEIMATEVTA